jgi:alkylhydroperoxidase family enzyme
LRAAVLEGPGALAPEVRSAAACSTPVGSAALVEYVERVRHAAFRTTDEQVAALRASGLTDDQIFELTIATALGAAIRQLDRGLLAIDAAEGD